MRNWKVHTVTVTQKGTTNYVPAAMIAIGPEHVIQFVGVKAGAGG